MNAATPWYHADLPGTSGPVRQALAYVGFASCYLLLGFYAADLPLATRLPYFIWPADGLLVGTLLVAPRRRWPVYLLIVFVVNLCVGLEVAAPMGRTLGAALVNMIGPTFVTIGLLQLCKPRVHVDSVRGLAAFLVGLVPLVAATSLLDASYSLIRYDAPMREQWSVIFVSDMIGMLLVAPLILGWSREGWREAITASRARLPELVVLYAGLTITAHYVFSARPESISYILPLAYLCTPFLIWAALAFGLRAATLALAVFGLIAYWHSSRGLGPFAIGGVADWRTILQLQGFLATIVITTLFAAALQTERQAAAETTRAWRRRYEAVIRASGNLLYDFDPESGFILWDGDTLAVLGIAPGAISHVRQWTGRVHPDDRMRLRGIRKRLISGEVSRVSMEYRMRRDDGEYVTLGVNGYAIAEPGPFNTTRRRVLGFVTDVSENIRMEEDRRRLEAQLKQAEKMEAVGHLAGGIAHDFNNILGAILGYGELAQLKAKDADLRRYLDTIMSAGNRAKMLVTQILSYSRADSVTRAPVRVGSVASEAFDLVRGSVAETMDVRLTDESQEGAVLGDPTRLHQLIMNLCTNALYAMPEGGTLELAVGVERVEEPRTVRSGQMPPGDYVRMTVRDTGHGIAPSVIDRIFEPFFTTKPAGRGTGLGLALVHAVVTEHQGYIDVASELGKGTSFTVWMPRLPEGTLVEEPTGGDIPRGRGQLVLVVDDEPQVLAALEEMLAALGYEPAGFESSREALEAFTRDPQRYEAVVSDEVMPEMSGTQLLVELRRLNPTIPVLIATGYGGAGFETRALSAGVNRVVKKPYRMNEIGEALASFIARNDN